MNEAFPTPHPNLIAFVQTMEERSRDRVDGLERLRRENNNEAPQEDVSIPEIPVSYYSFCV